MDINIDHYDAIITIDKLCFTNGGNTIIPEGRVLDTSYPHKFPDDGDNEWSFGAIEDVNVDTHVIYTFHHKLYVVDSGFFTIKLVADEFEKTVRRY